MKTEIFENYRAFLKREDKTINGVDQAFADQNPDYEKQNETNKGCWNCSDCSDCSDCRNCSDCSDCKSCWNCTHCTDCTYCHDSSYCTYCTGCSRCTDCKGLSDCSYCTDSSYCTDCWNCTGCTRETESKATPPAIPKVDNLDVVLYEVASCPNSLDMEIWHTCENTHSRDGWIVTLAGEEGKALEDFYNTELAAMLIYRESTGRRINPARFYDSNEDALADMKRLAEMYS